MLSTVVWASYDGDDDNDRGDFGFATEPRSVCCENLNNNICMSAHTLSHKTSLVSGGVGNAGATVHIEVAI